MCCFSHELLASDWQVFRQLQNTGWNGLSIPQLVVNTSYTGTQQGSIMHCAQNSMGYHFFVMVWASGVICPIIFSTPNIFLSNTFTELWTSKNNYGTWGSHLGMMDKNPGPESKPGIPACSPLGVSNYLWFVLNVVRSSQQWTEHSTSIVLSHLSSG